METKFSGCCRGKNSGCYSSRQFDHWLVQALKATDAPEQQHCYQRAEAQLAENIPLIRLFHQVAYRLVKPYVKNLYLLQHPQAPPRYRQSLK